MVEVVFFNTATGWAGTERYLLQLASALDRSRFSPRLLLPSLHPEELDAFTARFDGLDVPVERVMYPHGAGIPGLVTWATGLFRRQAERFGRRLLVHFNDEAPASNAEAILGAALARAGHRLATCHLATIGFAVEPLNLTGRTLVRVAYRTLDRVIFESCSNRDLALRNRLGRGGSFRVIEHGIDVSRYGSVDRAQARAQLGLREDELVLGSVGRLTDQKGHRYLLEALRRLDRRDVRVLIAGEGPLRDELERLAGGLPVTFLGQRDDVPRLLAALDVFVFPSEFEGLPFTLLEAMAAGVPVVASDVDGNRDAVEDEVTGILVPPRDPRALADAIGRQLERPDERARLGEAGRRRAAEVFSLERMVERTQAVYEELLR